MNNLSNFSNSSTSSYSDFVKKYITTEKEKVIENLKELGIEFDESKENLELFTLLLDNLMRRTLDFDILLPIEFSLVYGEADPLGAYGFIRNRQINRDFYLPNLILRKYSIKTGDIIVAIVKKSTRSENFPVQEVLLVNFNQPEESKGRPFIRRERTSSNNLNGNNLDYPRRENSNIEEVEEEQESDITKFDKLTACSPREKFVLDSSSSESVDSSSKLICRLVDILSPIGKGQRVIITASPRSGKTTLLLALADSIVTNNKNVELIFLLIDERPEEVTKVKKLFSNRAKIYFSTFDSETSNHMKVAKEALKYSKEKVLEGKDVVIVLDSLTRLTRASNMNLRSKSVGAMSGGLDQSALEFPRALFGSARATEEEEKTGTLTILSTALKETGNRIDDVICNEFQGRANSEIALDSYLSQLGIFPAIDIEKTGTREIESFLSQKDLNFRIRLRRQLIADFNEMERVNKLNDFLLRFKSNEEAIKFFPEGSNLHL